MQGPQQGRPAPDWWQGQEQDVPQQAGQMPGQGMQGRAEQGSAIGGNGHSMSMSRAGQGSAGQGKGMRAGQGRAGREQGTAGQGRTRAGTKKHLQHDMHLLGRLEIFILRSAKGVRRCQHDVQHHPT